MTPEKKKKKPKGRRARGTGSVFFHDGRQSWVARKTVAGVKLERWGRTQREAIDKLAEAMPPDPKSITVAQWAARWQTGLTVRVSTRHKYRVSLDKHILPAIGSMRLADVTTADVEALVARLLSGELEVGSVRTILAHCRTLFAAAVRSDLISRNPAAHARKPKPTAAEIETYTPDELARIIATAPELPAGGVIATLAATGMRMGEALALDVTDYDAAAGTLAITKTYSRRWGSGPPKSRHSRRTISVPEVIRGVLADAVADRTAGALFLTLEGNRRAAQTTAVGWRNAVRIAKIRYLKPHAMRHSVASALIGAGVPVPDVARYLGDTVATIVACYVHPTGVNPADTLNRLYGGQRVGNKPQTTVSPKKSQAMTV